MAVRQRDVRDAGHCVDVASLLFRDLCTHRIANAGRTSSISSGQISLGERTRSHPPLNPTACDRYALRIGVERPPVTKPSSAALGYRSCAAASTVNVSSQPELSLDAAIRDDRFSRNNGVFRWERPLACRGLLARRSTGDWTARLRILLSVALTRCSQSPKVRQQSLNEIPPSPAVTFNNRRVW